MTDREHLLRILRRKNNGAPGYWCGNMGDETVQKCAKVYGTVESKEAVAVFLGSQCRQVNADDCYKHPEGLSAFQQYLGVPRGKSHAVPGCFAEVETLEEVERHPWPNLDNLNFSPCYADLEKYSDKLCLTGMWSSIWKAAADFFGLENLMVQMYAEPHLVEATLLHVADYFVEANDRFFAGAGDRADALFS
ncbi:MAG: hypothetical protein LBJ11_00135 [Oscillospiraceae bacterium]|jgi:hypothetical protein|nr:hypothetical protein [Oscillospiraceae bacterium]